MFNLTRKQLIIITILVVVIILIIVANIFLFLRYSQRQVEVQRQTKIAQDIQTVQLEIDAGRLDQLDVAQLRSQGVAEEAIEIVEEAKRVQPLLSEEELVRQEIINIIENKQELYPLETDIHNAIVEKGEEIIPQLEILINNPDEMVRYFTHSALYTLAYNSNEKRSEIIPIVRQGLNDSELRLRILAASNLVNLGEKEGIPILISQLDNGSYFYLRQFISIHAYTTLKEVTGQDFIFDKDQWQQWWEANKDSLELNTPN